MKVWIAVLTATLCWAALVQPAAAYDTEETRATLKGLRSFTVDIFISDEIQHAGIDSTTIRTDTELRLRQSGISVVPGSGPTIQITLSGGPACGGHQLAVYERVEVLRIVDVAIATPGKPEYRYAATWSDGNLWVQGKTVAADIRDHVRDLVDRFLNAYLAANPKRSGSK